jgi:hypothetical protein
MFPTSHLADIVKADLGVDADYKNVGKRVTCLEPIAPSGAALKWYSLYPEQRSIPDEITTLARTYLMTTTLEARGLGFVILHRCGTEFYFLIACTWRGSNEIWETVFYKDGDAMTQFAPFPREGAHKPAFCIWELVPVWHEQQSWRRFLTSARDQAAAEAWLRDCYSGPA